MAIQLISLIHCFYIHLIICNSFVNKRDNSYNNSVVCLLILRCKCFVSLVTLYTQVLTVSLHTDGFVHLLIMNSILHKSDGETLKLYIDRVWNRIIIPQCSSDVQLLLLNEWKLLCKWQTAHTFMIESIGTFLNIKELVMMYRCNRHWHEQLRTHAITVWRSRNVWLISETSSMDFNPWDQMVRSSIFRLLTSLRINISQVAVNQWCIRNLTQLQHLQNLVIIHNVTQWQAILPYLQQWLPHLIKCTSLELRGVSNQSMLEVALQLPHLSDLIRSNLRKDQMPILHWRHLKIIGYFDANTLHEVVRCSRELRGLMFCVNQQKVAMCDNLILAISQLEELQILTLNGFLRTSDDRIWSLLFTANVCHSLHSLILTPISPLFLNHIAQMITYPLAQLKILHVQYNHRRIFKDIIRLAPNIRELTLSGQIQDVEFECCDVLLLKRLTWLESLSLSGAPYSLFKTIFDNRTIFIHQQLYDLFQRSEQYQKK